MIILADIVTYLFSGLFIAGVFCLTVGLLLLAGLKIIDAIRYHIDDWEGEIQSEKRNTLRNNALRRR